MRDFILCILFCVFLLPFVMVLMLYCRLRYPREFNHICSGEMGRRGHRYGKWAAVPLLLLVVSGCSSTPAKPPATYGPIPIKWEKSKEVLTVVQRPNVSHKYLVRSAPPEAKDAAPQGLMSSITLAWDEEPFMTYGGYVTGLMGTTNFTDWYHLIQFPLDAATVFVTLQDRPSYEFYRAYNDILK